MKYSFFFFAHQDDEFGVFNCINDEIKKGNEVVICYLTTGVKRGLDPRNRELESLKVLTSLGVKEKNIIFAGKLLEIPDSKLLDFLDTAFLWVENYLSKFTKIDSIYVHAYEGGHPDHDTSHVLLSLLCEKMGILRSAKQFSLYHSYNCPSFFYKVLSPLKSNGAVHLTRISWKNRFYFPFLIFNYKSQIKSFIGLFPFILYHYVLVGAQKIQSVNTIKLDHPPPHGGVLYYEKRGFCTWPVFKTKINNFVKLRRDN